MTTSSYTAHSNHDRFTSNQSPIFLPLVSVTHQSARCETECRLCWTQTQPAAVVTLSWDPPCPSLRDSVQVVPEPAGHAGHQVHVVVHAAAHAAVHQGPHSGLLGPRVKQVLGFVAAVHRTPGQAVLDTQGKKYTDKLKQQFLKGLNFAIV